MAVLRWMERKLLSKGRGLTYRSHPALCFAGSEISDIRFMPEHVAIVLNAVGARLRRLAASNQRNRPNHRRYAQ